jgi:hypothetical protein
LIGLQKASEVKASGVAGVQEVKACGGEENTE